MKNKVHLIYILLLFPFLAFSQSIVIKKLQEKYPDKGSYQYYYESVIRAAANLGAGKEGVELTKGIRKATVANLSKLENADEVYTDVQHLLKVANYETYFEVTNRGNLAGIAGFFMRQLQSLQNKQASKDSTEMDLSGLAAKMALYGKGTESTITALSIVLLGEKSVQIYEIQGKFDLESIPALIEKVQGVMELMNKM